MGRISPIRVLVVPRSALVLMLSPATDLRLGFLAEDDRIDHQPGARAATVGTELLIPQRLYRRKVISVASNYRATSI